MVMDARLRDFELIYVLNFEQSAHILTVVYRQYTNYVKHFDFTSARCCGHRQG